MSDLYIALDGYLEPCVWKYDPEHPDFPYLVARQSNLDHRLWAHLVSTLPTRDDPQPEPTDPAVRVVDDFGVTWARVGDKWATAENFRPRSWRQLNLLCGPLTVIPPVPDAEPEARPFKVGERVQLTDDATVTTFIGPLPAKYRGRAGIVVGDYDAGDGQKWNRVVLDGVAGEKQIVASSLVRLEARP